MPNVRIHRFNDPEGVPTEAAVAEAVFGAPVSADLLHRAVRIQLLNKRQGTAATKTRGESATWRQSDQIRRLIGNRKEARGSSSTMTRQ